MTSRIDYKNDGVTIAGVGLLNDKLQKITAGTLDGRTLKNAARAMGKIVSDKAKKLAPRRLQRRKYFKTAKNYYAKKGWKYITLRAAIKRKDWVFGGVVKSRIYIIKPTAHFIEEGFKTRLGKTYRAKSSKYIYRRRGGISNVKARPFLKQALYSSSNQAIDRASEIILKRIEQLTNGY